MLQHNKLKLVSLIAFSCFLLVGCQEEEVVDLPTPIYDSEKEQNYVSVRDYTDENKIELNEEVLRDVKGNIVRPSQYDVDDEVKAKFEAANHRSIVKLMHGLYIGLNNVTFKTVGENNDKDKYLVLDFTLYNTNSKEMSLGIFNDARLKLSDSINLVLDSKYHSENKELINFNNYKEMINENSERKVVMYFRFKSNGDVSPKSKNLDKLNPLGDIQLNNLGMNYILQDPVYLEDFTPEQFEIYKQNLKNLGLNPPNN